MNKTSRFLSFPFCTSLAIAVCGCVETAQRPDGNFANNAAVAIVSRVTWGSQEEPTDNAEHHVDRITIHHGGTKFADDRDAEEYLRGLQSWSRSDKGWMDIPYHFVIDLQGKIYEARPLRYAGDTNTSYDPAGHALIQVVGNYEERELSSAQLTAVIRLSAMLAQQFDVPIADIRGHLNYAPGETACPGKHIYRFLRDGTIADAVSEILSNQPSTP